MLSDLLCSYLDVFQPLLSLRQGIPRRPNSKFQTQSVPSRKANSYLNMIWIFRQSHRTANESNDSNKHSEWFQTGQTISDAIASRAGQSQSPKPPSQPRTASSKLNEKRQAYSSTVPKSRGTSSWSDVPIFAKGQKATMKKIENENRKNVEDEFEKTDVFSCPDCDKMYSNKRDLQIHKSFCYANVWFCWHWNRCKWNEWRM